MKKLIFVIKEKIQERKLKVDILAYRIDVSTNKRYIIK